MSPVVSDTSSASAVGCVLVSFEGECTQAAVEEPISTAVVRKRAVSFCGPKSQKQRQSIGAKMKPMGDKVVIKPSVQPKRVSKIQQNNTAPTSGGGGKVSAIPKHLRAGYCRERRLSWKRDNRNFMHLKRSSPLASCNNSDFSSKY